MKFSNEIQISIESVCITVELSSIKFEKNTLESENEIIEYIQENDYWVNKNGNPVNESIQIEKMIVYNLMEHVFMKNEKWNEESMKWPLTDTASEIIISIIEKKISSSWGKEESNNKKNLYKKSKSKSKDSNLLEVECSLSKKSNGHYKASLNLGSGEKRQSNREGKGDKDLKKRIKIFPKSFTANTNNFTKKSPSVTDRTINHEGKKRFDFPEDFYEKYKEEYHEDVSSSILDKYVTGLVSEAKKRGMKMTYETLTEDDLELIKENLSKLQAIMNQYNSQGTIDGIYSRVSIKAMVDNFFNSESKEKVRILANQEKRLDEESFDFFEYLKREQEQIQRKLNQQGGINNEVNSDTTYESLDFQEVDSYGDITNYKLMFKQSESSQGKNSKQGSIKNKEPKNNQPNFKYFGNSEISKIEGKNEISKIEGKNKISSMVENDHEISQKLEEAEKKINEMLSKSQFESKKYPDDMKLHIQMSKEGVESKEFEEDFSQSLLNILKETPSFNKNSFLNSFFHDIQLEETIVEEVKSDSKNSEKKKSEHDKSIYDVSKAIALSTDSVELLKEAQIFYEKLETKLFLDNVDNPFKDSSPYFEDKTILLRVINANNKLRDYMNSQNIYSLYSEKELTFFKVLEYGKKEENEEQVHKFSLGDLISLQDLLEKRLKDMIFRHLKNDRVVKFLIKNVGMKENSWDVLRANHLKNHEVSFPEDIQNMITHQVVKFVEKALKKSEVRLIRRFSSDYSIFKDEGANISILNGILSLYETNQFKFPIISTYFRAFRSKAIAFIVKILKISLLITKLAEKLENRLNGYKREELYIMINNMLKAFNIILKEEELSKIQINLGMYLNEKKSNSRSCFSAEDFSNFLENSNSRMLSQIREETDSETSSLYREKHKEERREEKHPLFFDLFDDFKFEEHIQEAEDQNILPRIISEFYSENFMKGNDNQEKIGIDTQSQRSDNSEKLKNNFFSKYQVKKGNQSDRSENDQPTSMSSTIINLSSIYNKTYDNSLSLLNKHKDKGKKKKNEQGVLSRAKRILKRTSSIPKKGNNLKMKSMEKHKKLKSSSTRNLKKSLKFFEKARGYYVPASRRKKSLGKLTTGSKNQNTLKDNKKKIKVSKFLAPKRSVRDILNLETDIQLMRTNKKKRKKSKTLKNKRKNVKKNESSLQDNQRPPSQKTLTIVQRSHTSPDQSVEGIEESQTVGKKDNEQIEFYNSQKKLIYAHLRERKSPIFHSKGFENLNNKKKVHQGHHKSTLSLLNNVDEIKDVLLRSKRGKDIKMESMSDNSKMEDSSQILESMSSDISSNMIQRVIAQDSVKEDVNISADKTQSTLDKGNLSKQDFNASSYKTQFINKRGYFKKKNHYTSIHRLRQNMIREKSKELKRKNLKRRKSKSRNKNLFARKKSTPRIGVMTRTQKTGNARRRNSQPKKISNKKINKNMKVDATHITTKMSLRDQYLLETQKSEVLRFKNSRKANQKNDEISEKMFKSYEPEQKKFPRRKKSQSDEQKKYIDIKFEIEEDKQTVKRFKSEIGKYSGKEAKESEIDKPNLTIDENFLKFRSEGHLSQSTWNSIPHHWYDALINNLARSDHLKVKIQSLRDLKIKPHVILDCLIKNFPLSVQTEVINLHMKLEN